MEIRYSDSDKIDISYQEYGIYKVIKGVKIYGDKEGGCLDWLSRGWGQFLKAINYAIELKDDQGKTFYANIRSLGKKLTSETQNDALVVQAAKKFVQESRTASVVPSQQEVVFIGPAPHLSDLVESEKPYKRETDEIHKWIKANKSNIKKENASEKMKELQELISKSPTTKEKDTDTEGSFKGRTLQEAAEELVNNKDLSPEEVKDFIDEFELTLPIEWRTRYY